MKKLGILGGMGPDSSSIYYQSVLSEFQKRRKPRYDQDYPEIVLYNLPIPDPVSGITDPELTLKTLVTGLKKLELMQVDFITIPCNTIGIFINELRGAIETPILGIIESTLKVVRSKKIKKVGLLATGVTIKNNLYSKPFAKNNIMIFTPSNQIKIDQVIRNIVGGKKNREDKKILTDAIAELKYKGVDYVILGCTDLPVILKQSDIINQKVKLIDSVKSYAEQTVEYLLV